MGNNRGNKEHRVAQDVSNNAMVGKLETAVSATTEQSMVSSFEISNLQSSEDSNKRKGFPRAARTAVKRKRISTLWADQSMDHYSDIVGSSGGLSSIRATQKKSNKKNNHVKDALHRVPKNGLYILCSETQEIIDPELLRRPSSLVMDALHELGMQDQLYGRIGRAYGMWLLAAPIKVESFNHNHFCKFSHICP